MVLTQPLRLQHTLTLVVRILKGYFKRGSAEPLFVYNLRDGNIFKPKVIAKISIS